MPLINPPLKPTDFDALLEEIGLNILPQEEKDAVADKAREMATYSVIRKLRENLSDQQLTELETLWVKAEEDGNYTAVNEFLLKNVPNAEALSDEAVEEVKELIRDSFKDFPKIVKKHVDEYMEKREQFDNTGQQRFEQIINDRINERDAEAAVAPSLEDKSESTEENKPNATEATTEPEAFFPWEQQTHPVTEAPQATPPASTTNGTESFLGINEELAALEQQSTSYSPALPSNPDEDSSQNNADQSDIRP
jgi:hypothetical protein